MQANVCIVDRKREDAKHAKLTLRVNNMQESRDHIDVQYPTDRSVAIRTFPPGHIPQDIPLRQFSLDNSTSFFTWNRTFYPVITPRLGSNVAVRSAEDRTGRYACHPPFNWRMALDDNISVYVKGGVLGGEGNCPGWICPGRNVLHSVSHVSSMRIFHVYNWLGLLSICGRVSVTQSTLRLYV